MTNTGCDTAGCAVVVLAIGLAVLALVWDVTPRRRVQPGDTLRCLGGSEWPVTRWPEDGDE